MFLPGNGHKLYLCVLSPFPPGLITSSTIMGTLLVGSGCIIALIRFLHLPHLRAITYIPMIFTCPVAHRVSQWWTPALPYFSITTVGRPSVGLVVGFPVKVLGPILDLIFLRNKWRECRWVMPSVFHPIHLCRLKFILCPAAGDPLLHCWSQGGLSQNTSSSSSHSFVLDNFIK